MENLQFKPKTGPKTLIPLVDPDYIENSVNILDGSFRGEGSVGFESVSRRTIKDKKNLNSFDNGHTNSLRGSRNGNRSLLEINSQNRVYSRPQKSLRNYMNSEPQKKLFPRFDDIKEDEEGPGEWDDPEDSQFSNGSHLLKSYIDEERRFLQGVKKSSLQEEILSRTMKEPLSNTIKSNLRTYMNSPNSLVRMKLKQRGTATPEPPQTGLIQKAKPKQSAKISSQNEKGYLRDFMDRLTRTRADLQQRSKKLNDLILKGSSNLNRLKKARDGNPNQINSLEIAKKIISLKKQNKEKIEKKMKVQKKQQKGLIHHSSHVKLTERVKAQDHNSALELVIVGAQSNMSLAEAFKKNKSPRATELELMKKKPKKSKQRAGSAELDKKELRRKMMNYGRKPQNKTKRRDSMDIPEILDDQKSFLSLDPKKHDLNLLSQKSPDPKIIERLARGIKPTIEKREVQEITKRQLDRFKRLKERDNISTISVQSKREELLARKEKVKELDKVGTFIIHREYAIR